jgi:predicted O-methyltransferase YrrM
MQENGILHTIDIKEELVDFQRKHFDKSPWEAQIIQHLGEAVDIIPTLKFDLVLLMPIRKTILIISFFQNEQRRIILSDNVLWSGKVLEPLHPNDVSTKYYRIQRFKKMTQGSKPFYYRLETA